ncbi:hypothetical protein ROHU_018227 [Labeo rohita]|uniref:Uncharacterized protein n=1 Tax=Labeo rohita TaxID=84645 RepID=A0A498N9I2_LABRO|nr:hypothetical protein ROHU_018227 [Labeo rohita]
MWSRCGSPDANAAINPELQHNASLPVREMEERDEALIRRSRALHRGRGRARGLTFSADTRSYLHSNSSMSEWDRCDFLGVR